MAQLGIGTVGTERTWRSLWRKRPTYMLITGEVPEGQWVDVTARVKVEGDTVILDCFTTTTARP